MRRQCTRPNESPAGLSRRNVIKATAAMLAGSATTAGWVRAADEPGPPARTSAEPFGYCLNTSTISGQNLGIVAEIELAAKVGFNALEPWIRELEAYQKSGGSLQDLQRQIKDHGLKIPDAIGFAHWIVDDPAERAAGMEQAKRDMDLAVRIGATHIAAPPIGANNKPGPPLPVIAERYRALLELGDQIGIVPVLELWGSSKTLSQVGEAAYVAAEAHHPKSCILLDIYHLYKGGSGFDSLHLLSGHALPVVHTNDYPSDPPREKIVDAFRVYPGDGVAPLTQIFRTLRDINFSGYLSVELFNRSYWKESPLKVATAALEKTREAVRKALG
ncbi:MAG TPA: sugar phosphate isomerase/epimerase family protein [Tepidisphaeraceae bacterium]|nr:sugar phosphate isomerase/epimerase family protein [Tepidisphaeraceae bacterium]